MHIVESREVAFLVGQAGVPVLKPDLSPRGVILLIEPTSGPGVQGADDILECAGVSGGMGDEVVVVGHDRPSL